MNILETKYKLMVSYKDFAGSCININVNIKLFKELEKINKRYM